jgi:hypothetical protein
MAMTEMRTVRGDSRDATAVPPNELLGNVAVTVRTILLYQPAITYFFFCVNIVLSAIKSSNSVSRTRHHFIQLSLPDQL